MIFLARFWDVADEPMRRRLVRAVESGQLELTTDGWVCRTRRVPRSPRCSTTCMRATSGSVRVSTVCAFCSTWRSFEMPLDISQNVLTDDPLLLVQYDYLIASRHYTDVQWRLWEAICCRAAGRSIPSATAQPTRISCGRQDSAASLCTGSIMLSSDTYYLADHCTLEFRWRQAFGTKWVLFGTNRLWELVIDLLQSIIDFFGLCVSWLLLINEQQFRFSSVCKYTSVQYRSEPYLRYYLFSYACADIDGHTELLMHMMPRLLFYYYGHEYTCGPGPDVCCQFDFICQEGYIIQCGWGTPAVNIAEKNVAEKWVEFDTIIS